MTYDELLVVLARQLAAEVEADRLELRLWRLVLGNRWAEARTRRHPIGLELVVTIDGEIASTQAFRPIDVDCVEAVATSARIALTAAAEQKRVEFQSEGWTNG